MNIKRLKVLLRLWLLSLAFWSYGSLGLRIRSLVTLRHWGLWSLWNSSVYKCYSAHFFWSPWRFLQGIGLNCLYAGVVLNSRKFIWDISIHLCLIGFIWCKLAHEAFIIHLMIITSLCVANPKDRNSMLTSICQALTSCLVRSFLP